jgi:RNA polymerase sigma-70 factor (ECF subfamily)
MNEIPFVALDRSEFEKLFRAHFKSMVFYAQRYVKDLDASREIVQESFISLWERRDNINAAGLVRSYLSTSVHNKCLNYLREHKKFNKNLLAVENLINEPAELDDPMIHEETATLVQKAIDELPEKCREVFLLSRFEHKKYQEIADQLGISVKTVEAQMSKALQHMKARLGDHLGLMLLIWMISLN